MKTSDSFKGAVAFILGAAAVYFLFATPRINELNDTIIATFVGIWILLVSRNFGKIEVWKLSVPGLLKMLLTTNEMFYVCSF